MMHMVDLVQMRVFEQRHRVKPRHVFADILERGFQPAKRLHIGARAGEFVPIQNGQPVAVLDGDQGPVKPALILRHLGAALGFHGIGIHILARETVFGGDDIG